MKKVLDVFDISEIKNKGYVLAGTYKEHNSLMTDEIKRTFGKHVILLVNNQKIELDVLDVKVTNSIINQKNIFVLVGLNEKLNEIKNHSKIELYV